MSEKLEITTDDVIVVCGKRRSGKSVWVKHMAKALPRRIIWDINHEHSDLGFVCHYLQQLKPEWERGMKHMVFQPFDKSEEAFNEFCGLCFALTNYTLIIEEAERYATSHYMPFNLKKIVDTGRHYGIGLIVSCRRVHRLNPDIPFNADHIIVFRLHRPQDSQYLAEWIGQIAYQAQHLDPFFYIHYDDDFGEAWVRKPVPFKEEEEPESDEMQI